METVKEQDMAELVLDYMEHYGSPEYKIGDVVVFNSKNEPKTVPIYVFKQGVIEQAVIAVHHNRETGKIAVKEGVDCGWAYLIRTSQAETEWIEEDGVVTNMTE